MASNASVNESGDNEPSPEPEKNEEDQNTEEKLQNDSKSRELSKEEEVAETKKSESKVESGAKEETSEDGKDENEQEKDNKDEDSGDESGKSEAGEGAEVKEGEQVKNKKSSKTEKEGTKEEGKGDDQEVEPKQEEGDDEVQKDDVEVKGDLKKEADDEQIEEDGEKQEGDEKEEGEESAVDDKKVKQEAPTDGIEGIEDLFADIETEIPDGPGTKDVIPEAGDDTQKTAEDLSTREASKKKTKRKKHSEDLMDINYQQPSSGDFKLISQSATDDIAEVIYDFKFDEIEEGEEEASEEEEEEEPIDREPYLEKFEIIREDMKKNELENTILTQMLATFFRKRKMDYVLDEAGQTFGSQKKYNEALDNLEEVIDALQKQKLVTQTEQKELKEKEEIKEMKLEQLFKEMQENEREVGTGLTFSKTGNVIPDKVVERLIRRQKMLMLDASQMRYKYIVLKDMMTEKENAIAELDNVGEGLHLMDYEQLKVENRSHADKIEEREEELTLLRFRCEKTIQILAHHREKSTALEWDVSEQRFELSQVDNIMYDKREFLNELKQERDKTRIQINELKRASGLLTENSLLRDMKKSIDELELATQELTNLVYENSIKSVHIRNIRKNLESAAEAMAIKKSLLHMGETQALKPQITKVKKVYPTLHEVKLPENAFKDLLSFIKC